MSLLRRLAAGATVPVFVAVGPGGRDAVRTVLVDPRVELARSPRHATVLLVAGGAPAAARTALAHVHDQLPRPRAVVWASPDGPPEGLVEPSRVGPEDDLVAAAVDAHRAVVLGGRPSSARTGPAAHPVDWHGSGDHGQGGEGMMGGTPYGRPMAMTGEDPYDGLTLDRMAVTLGPYLAPWWPPGLELEVEFQGDRLVAAQLAEGTWATAGRSAPDPVLDVMLALGDRRTARRWLAAGEGRSVRGTVEHALRGLAAGTGWSPVDGRDVRGRLLASVDGSAAPMVGPEQLSDLLPGLGWREAAVTIASLGLDFSPLPAGGAR